MSASPSSTYYSRAEHGTCINGKLILSRISNLHECLNFIPNSSALVCSYFVGSTTVKNSPGTTRSAAAAAAAVSAAEDDDFDHNDDSNNNNNNDNEEGGREEKDNGEKEEGTEDEEMASSMGGDADVSSSPSSAMTTTTTIATPAATGTVVVLPREHLKLEVQVQSQFQLLWAVFQSHSTAEDEVIWPALKEKARASGGKVRSVLVIFSRQDGGVFVCMFVSWWYRLQAVGWGWRGEGAGKPCARLAGGACRGNPPPPHRSPPHRRPPAPPTPCPCSLLRRSLFHLCATPADRRYS